MFCKSLDKEFESKKEMFAELKANKEILIAAKKSEIKTKSNSFSIITQKESTQIKGIPDLEKGFFYAVISNTNYMDFHDDVHLMNSMNQTAVDQNRKVYYVADHELKVNNIISTPKNVEIMIKETDFVNIGVDSELKTQLFLFKIKADKIMHSKAKQLIEDKEAIENSIRMMYVNLDLAINSTDEAYKDEYKNWNEVYPKLGNKERAAENGMFWAVRELKIVKEGSMVLFGSNDATPIESKEAAESTSNDEPLENTREMSIKLQQLLKLTN
jgi:hypothetical protein